MKSSCAGPDLEFARLAAARSRNRVEHDAISVYPSRNLSTMRCFRSHILGRRLPRVVYQQCLPMPEEFSQDGQAVFEEIEHVSPGVNQSDHQQEVAHRSRAPMMASVPIPPITPSHHSRR